MAAFYGSDDETTVKTSVRLTHVKKFQRSI